ncbi:MAG: hypothetical protein FWF36_08725 [Propionibacteriaceae bacterium]|nr:hypothetical protein [Propionibacteriaceae bacterium]
MTGISISLGKWLGLVSSALMATALLAGCSAASTPPATTNPAPVTTTQPQPANPAPPPATSTTTSTTQPPTTAGIKAPPAKFSIVGAWKVVGDQGWGQAQPGAIVIFTNANQCTLYSPQDTYMYSNGTLSGTGLLGGNYTFKVDYTDDNNIALVDSSIRISLSR